MTRKHRHFAYRLADYLGLPGEKDGFPPWEIFLIIVSPGLIVISSVALIWFFGDWENLDRNYQRMNMSDRERLCDSVSEDVGRTFGCSVFESSRKKGRLVPREGIDAPI